MRTMTRVLAAMGLAGAAVVGGCGSSMGQYNVTASMDESLRDAASKRLPSVEVDVVGVNEADAPRWRTYPVSQYFSGNDDFRRSAQKDAYTMKFANDASAPQTVKISHEQWKHWHKLGATRLFILANIPGARPEGGEDPRRLELPLASNRWSGDTIEVSIEKAGVKLRTPMKPEK